jgi:hypothetical protein
MDFVRVADSLREQATLSESRRTKSKTCSEPGQTRSNVDSSDT